VEPIRAAAEASRATRLIPRIRSCDSKRTTTAEAIAAKVHPRWAYLGNGARLLQSRNSHQVLGRNLDDPVRFVLCWTPDGATSWRETSQKTGGTGQAIRLASQWDAGVHNLQRPDYLRAWEEWLATSPTT
jgi:hypothetical protein